MKKIIQPQEPISKQFISLYNILLNMDYDVIIDGAGPAGLSAAITAAYYKLNVLVFDSASSGGALVNQYPWKKVDNYLGIYEKNGMEVANSMTEHATKENVKINENEMVKSIERRDGLIHVETSKSQYTAKSLILACGLGSPRKMGVGGETLNGVKFSLTDLKIHKGKRIYVVGGGDTAVECAVELKQNGADVFLVHCRDTFRATEKNIHSLSENKVDLKCDECEKEYDADYVLFSLGTIPHMDFLNSIGIDLDERNMVKLDSAMRTKIEGVFAAGDIVGKWIRIPQAVGEGGLA